MPGTNLTRDEAAIRAALLDVTSYSIDLDLTTATPPSAPRRRSVFSCREPGASTFADLVGATIHEMTLNGEPVDPSAYADSRIALSGLAAENTLVVRADCTYSRTGEGLHRFVDPADDRVYLYSQFEVPDARRVYTTFEQPDLKAPYTFTVTTPAGWAVSSNAATPEPEPAGDGSGRSGRFPTTQPMSTYITALVAGEYHRLRCTTPTQARTARSSWATTAASRSLSTSTSRHVGDHQAGLRVLRGRFDFPYPFGKYDQPTCPSTTWARWRTPGCVTFRDEYLPRSAVQPLVLRAARRGDPPRDGAHVVRRPRDHAVVGRPLAQRGRSRSGRATTRQSSPPSSPSPGPASQTPARTELQDHPQHPPDRRGRPGPQAVEVNFDGITYAKGASVLNDWSPWSASTRSSRACVATSRTSRSRTPGSRTC